MMVLSQSRDARIPHSNDSSKSSTVDTFQTDAGGDYDNNFGVTDDYFAIPSMDVDLTLLQSSLSEDSGLSRELGPITSKNFESCFHMDESEDIIMLSDPAVRIHADQMVGLKQLKVNMSKKRKRDPPGEDNLQEDLHSIRGAQRRRIHPMTEIDIMTDFQRRGCGAPSPDSIVEMIILERKLNTNSEQERAFRVIAQHALDQRGAIQLIMYISGIGGTGKSHLIHSILLFFERLGRRNEILVGAPTGCAARLIGGNTLHSLAQISSKKGGKTEGDRRSHKTDKSSLMSTWKNVKYLIIDEVSMLGALLMSKLSQRMCQAMGNNPNACGVPFGGVNVIFCGDFGQLQLVDTSLFAHRLVKAPDIQEGRCPKGTGALHGAFLWRTVNTVVELEKNQRQAADPDYAAFLARLRLGRCIPPGKEGVMSDYDYLKPRFLENIIARGESLDNFSEALIIVGTKKLRDAFNNTLVTFHSKRKGQQGHKYYSQDTVAGNTVSPEFQRHLWGLPSSVVEDSLGVLPLFIGMLVTVTDNLALDDGVVNGSVGEVVSILYDSDLEGRRYAKVVHVRIEGSELQIPGMEVGVVPIFPSLKYVGSKAKNLHLPGGTKSFSRVQLPLLPAYAVTDYKSQGRSTRTAYVDIWSSRGQGAYVMLSRVTTLKGVVILRCFPPDKLYQRLPTDLRNELNHLDDLKAETLRKFENRAPGCVLFFDDRAQWLTPIQRMPAQ